MTTSRAFAVPLAGLRLAASTVLSGVISSIYLIAVARLLGSREFSDLAVCLSLSYVALLFLGPLSLTLIRFSAVYHSGNDAARIRPLVGYAARLYAPWVGVAIAVSVIFASALARVLRVETAALIPLTGVLSALGLALGAVRAIALGLGENRWYSGSVLLDAVVRFAAGAVLAVAYRSALAALAGFLVGNAVALVVLGVRTWRRLPRTRNHWAESSDVQRFMARALVFSTVVQLLQNVDMIAAKIRLGPGDAGDYAVVLAITRGFLLVSSPFVGVALGRMTASQQRGWARIAHEPVATYAALSVIAVVILSLAAQPILTGLYGHTTPMQVSLMPLLSVACAAAGAFAILAQDQIRNRQFRFVAPLAITLAAELIILMSASTSPMVIAWTALGAQVSAVGGAVVAPWILSRQGHAKVAR